MVGKMAQGANYSLYQHESLNLDLQNSCVNPWTFRGQVAWGTLWQIAKRFCLQNGGR